MYGQLTNLLVKVKTGQGNKETVMAAFLDISSAYDNVDRDILVEKLRREKCSELFGSIYMLQIDETRDTRFSRGNRRNR